MRICAIKRWHNQHEHNFQLIEGTFSSSSLDRGQSIRWIKAMDRVKQWLSIYSQRKVIAPPAHSHSVVLLLLLQRGHQNFAYNTQYDDEVRGYNGLHQDGQHVLVVPHSRRWMIGRQSFNIWHSTLHNCFTTFGSNSGGVTVQPLLGGH